MWRIVEVAIIKGNAVDHEGMCVKFERNGKRGSHSKCPILYKSI